mgnify:CR=1 FL=1
MTSNDFDIRIFKLENAVRDLKGVVTVIFFVLLMLVVVLTIYVTEFLGKVH